jgi:hypothetical protein
VLQAGDRLMLVVQPEGVDALTQILEPMGAAQAEDGSHLSHEGA